MVGMFFLSIKNPRWPPLHENVLTCGKMKNKFVQKIEIFD
jgi:hypothetical protein